MSFILKVQDLAQVHFSEEGKYQDMLTHSHAIELFILICEKVKKINRNHSHCHNCYHIVSLYRFMLHNTHVQVKVEKGTEIEVQEF